MKEQSVQINLIEDVPTASHHPLMTEEFLKVYRQALTSSNLDLNVLKFRNVSIYNKEHLHEVYTLGPQALPHIVLLHGYGGTSLTFVKMFQHLKQHFHLHALDTFGVGLSSRGNWHNEMNGQQAAEYYIEAIEEWRKKIGLQKFVLAGHSFGGYIGTLYFERYPERVSQLMLLSPAGTARFTEEEISERANKAPYWFCVAEKVYNLNIRPSKAMSNYFFGNKLMDRILKNRLKLPQNEQTIWRRYLKHVNNQKECSQKGFYALFDWPVQPQRSIEMILKDKKTTVPIDFMYGDQDWMKPAGAHRLAKEFENITVHQVKSAGHQMLFDNPEEVVNIMRKVLKEIKDDILI